jgi:protein-disulfide isomerase
MMDADAAEADSLGFVGTPYFLVNDIVVRGALSLEEFSKAVDMALEKKAGK